MTKRYILILKGSPREKGNSSLLAEQAAAGARDAGAEVESFDLQTLNIQPCTACEACHETPEEGCIIEDSMRELYPRLRRADGIVIATPIYWFTMSAQTKLVIDRWYALEGADGNALKGKDFGVILTYGDTDPFSSGAINAMRTFQDMCAYLRANLTGFVYGSASEAGDVLKQPDLLKKAYQMGHRLGSSA
jgi:multimeric flavodoxin WrbA